MFYHWATQPTDTLKKRQSTDPNQRPGLILASFTTGPWKKGQCSLYATSPTSVPYLQVETSTKKDILNEANCWYATINRSFRWFDRSTLNRSVNLSIPVTVQQAESTLTAVGLFQLLAPRSGTLSQTLLEIQRSEQTGSDVYLKCIWSLNTTASSTLEVVEDNCAI